MKQSLTGGPANPAGPGGPASPRSPWGRVEVRVKIQSAKGLKSSSSAPDRQKKQTGTYRGSAGSGRSNRSSRTRLSLISGGSSRSRKSNWSTHTTGTILTRSTISTLGSLVTLGYWMERESEVYCIRGEHTSLPVIQRASCKWYHSWSEFTVNKIVQSMPVLWWWWYLCWKFWEAIVDVGDRCWVIIVACICCISALDLWQ